MLYDLIVLGGGPAGYSAAEKAAHSGLSTLLIEKSTLGGVCLNEGCIPTKTLLYSAKVLETALHGDKYAVQSTATSIDLPKLITRKTKVIRKLVAGVKAKMNEAGSKCYRPRLLSVVLIRTDNPPYCWRGVLCR